MLDKIKNLQNHPWVTEIRDIRAVAFGVFGVLVLLVSWSSVNIIETNYKLERQLAKLQQQNEVARLENQNQKLRNEYYGTDEYQELQARKQFGKGLPGETLLLVPKEVALAHTVEPTIANSEVSAAEKPTPPRYQQNLQAWRDFLFRRSLAPSS